MSAVSLKRKKQMGLSLMELMISMVVGLFLLAGVVSSFISTTDSDRTRNAISEMDASANAVFEVMRKTVKHAGYKSIDPVQSDIPAFFVDGETISSANCRDGSLRETNDQRASIDGTEDLANRDVLAVVYLADNPCIAGQPSCAATANVNPQALVYTDCTGGGMTRDTTTVSCSADPNVGMPNREEALVYNSFTLHVSNRELSCNGSRGGSQPIADNVEAIQYLYGVRQGNGNVTFQNADAISNADWSRVDSVQVALLMRSSEQYLLDQNSDKTFYSLLNQRVDIATADLKRLFRVYTTTINLENMN